MRSLKWVIKNPWEKKWAIVPVLQLFFVLGFLFSSFPTAILWPPTLSCVSVFLSLWRFLFLLRYDSYGRLTNVTYPTGRVSSYRTDSDGAVWVQAEGSNKEDIVVTTNLSASGTFYTLMQGQLYNRCVRLSINHPQNMTRFHMKSVSAIFRL